jgi:hypothetical protein
MLDKAAVEEAMLAAGYSKSDPRKPQRLRCVRCCGSATDCSIDQRITRRSRPGGCRRLGLTTAV